MKTFLKFSGTILIAIIIFNIIIELTLSLKKDNSHIISDANYYVKLKNYETASSKLKQINSHDPLYPDAKKLLIKIDSLKDIEGVKKVDINTTENKSSPSNKTYESDLVLQLKDELEWLSNDPKFLVYRGSINTLLLELVVFNATANLINEAKNSQDKEVKKLANAVEHQLKIIQKKEFPILRKEITKELYKKYWIEDIDVKIGPGTRIMNFTGYYFSLNRNIDSFNSDVFKILKLLRFQEVRYRSSKYDDEYTYYKLFNGVDSDLVTIDQINQAV